jgi:hypothetical protein
MGWFNWVRDRTSRAMDSGLGLGGLYLGFLGCPVGFLGQNRQARASNPKIKNQTAVSDIQDSGQTSYSTKLDVWTLN